MARRKLTPEQREDVREVRKLNQQARRSSKRSGAKRSSSGKGKK